MIAAGLSSGYDCISSRKTSMSFCKACDGSNASGWGYRKAASGSLVSKRNRRQIVGAGEGIGLPGRRNGKQFNRWRAVVSSNATRYANKIATYLSETLSADGDDAHKPRDEPADERVWPEVVFGTQSINPSHPSAHQSHIQRGRIEMRLVIGRDKKQPCSSGEILAPPVCLHSSLLGVGSSISGAKV